MKKKTLKNITWWESQGHYTGRGSKLGQGKERKYQGAWCTMPVDPAGAYGRD